MSNQSGAASPRERHAVDVKIGNAMEIEKSLSAAIAKRAGEINQVEGSFPACDQENMRLAQYEILEPLCSCGILESKDEATISMFSSALRGKDIDEIEVGVEPHRLILVGRNASTSKSGKDAAIYRELSLVDEFDPSSAKLVSEPHGSLIEIQIHKCGKGEFHEHRAA